MQRLTVKFFVQDPAVVYLPQLIPVFHRWIQTQAVAGLLLDVVDYKHVHQGPGVLLIGHEVDYALDMEDGRPGLLLRRKRQNTSVPLTEQLLTALQWATQARQVLEQEPLLAEPWYFRPDEVEVTFPDRLHAPNTDETWETYRPAVAAALQITYPSATIHLERLSSDPRHRLGYRVILKEG